MNNFFNKQTSESLLDKAATIEDVRDLVATRTTELLAEF